MSEFTEYSEPLSSPTSFVFENLHDVEELLIVDNEEHSTKKDLTKKLSTERRITFDEQDEVLILTISSNKLDHLIDVTNILSL